MKKIIRMEAIATCRWIIITPLKFAEGNGRRTWEGDDFF
jgi:hypothetical protein